MMNKERLEKIKERYMEHEYDYALSAMDINWLIEQAELREEQVQRNLQALENISVLEGIYDRLEKQNQRYKQALEFYANKKTYERRCDPYEPLDTDINDDRGHKARKALEESK